MIRGRGSRAGEQNRLRSAWHAIPSGFGGVGVYNASVDLSSIEAGTGGFVINGEQAGDESGRAVASAGDVNGDGVDDLIVGAYRANRSDNGKSYVVFGRSTGFSTSVDLTSISGGTGGFVINGGAADTWSGRSVATAGDFNGDGFDDLIIGGFFGGAGKSYLIFGRGAGFKAPVNLTNVAAGTGGFVIYGQTSGDRLGYSVASAGDFNGDGFDDLVVGAPGADPMGVGSAGNSYILFGRGAGFGASIDLAHISAGTGGFVIRGTLRANDDETSTAREFRP